MPITARPHHPHCSMGTTQERGHHSSRDGHRRVGLQAHQLGGAVTDGLGEDGRSIEIRRVVVRLDKPTRDGDADIAVLTNVPTRDAGAGKIAELHRGRWTLEGLFQTLTQTLTGEIPSLGYPKVALFAFGVALASYNIASVLRTALCVNFGQEKVKRGCGFDPEQNRLCTL